MAAVTGMPARQGNVAQTYSMFGETGKIVVVGILAFAISYFSRKAAYQQTYLDLPRSHRRLELANAAGVALGRECAAVAFIAVILFYGFNSGFQ